MNRAASRDASIDGALRVSAVVVMIALIALLTFVPLAANDFWLQAKIGQMIVESGVIPRTVLFPYTWVQANTFNAHEWLPSIIFHLLDRTFGYERLLFAQGAIGLMQFGLCLLLARRLSGSLAIGLLLAAMAMVVANYRYDLRPEIFALLLFVALLHVLTSYRKSADWRVLAWAAPIAVIWANSHGSFLVGPVVAAIFAVGEAAEAARGMPGTALRTRFRAAAHAAIPYAIVVATMVLTSLLNPLGLGLLHFAVTLSSSEVTKTFIGEWTATLSPRFMGRLPFAIFVAAAGATLAIVVPCRRRLTVTDALLLAAFAALALQRTRFIVFFGFAALAVCAHLLGAMPWRRELERPALAAALGLAALGIALALRFGNVWGAYPFAAPSTNFTAPMIEKLSRPQMRGNVLNSYELGAELIYRTYPRLRPSIDSRIDSYGDRYFLLQEHLFIEEPLLKEFVADFDVRYMLLLWREFDRLTKMKGLRQDWRVEFADHKAVLLERIDAATKESKRPAVD